MEQLLPNDNHQMDGEAIPTLFSFIVLRRENIGGFLFNPYLFNEISLNEIEMCILEHCTGRLSLKEIIDIISKEFSFTYDISQQCIYKAFRVFNGYYAIKWSQKKQDFAKLITGSTPILSYSKSADCKPRNLDILSAPISILWEITHKCNSRCKHCLTDAGKPKENELTLEEVKKYIEQLAEMKVFKITFGGGEPLVRKDFLDILKYASKFTFGIKLTTNGSLVDNNLLKQLKSLKVFSAQVSVDGLKRTHNAFRRRKNSFEEAIAALKAFSAAGYWTIMVTALTRYNINEIEALLELAVKCGVSSFKVSPFIPVGRGKKNFKKLAISKLQIKNLAKKMVQKKKEYKDIIDMQIDGLFPWLFESHSKGRTNTIQGPFHVGCSAGVSHVVITPTGNILPCPFFRNFIAGNLRKYGLKDIWNNSEIFNEFRNLKSNQLEGECRNCNYVPYYCQGGCRAAALAWTKNLFAHDPYCWKELL